MIRNFTLLVLACATFVIAPLAVLAAPITVPTGLNSGDQYRLAFVTTTFRDATSTSISDYNAFVTLAANSQPALAALGSTWSVIGSTSSVDARDNTSTNPSSTGFPIYRLDDNKIANDNADLWDGSLINTLNIAETGNVVITTLQHLTLTGTASNGAAHPAPLGAAFSLVGAFDSTNSQWIAFSATSSTDSLHFYAISGVLTVPAIPEPGTMVLAALGAIGLAGWSWPRHRKSRG